MNGLLLSKPLNLHSRILHPSTLSCIQITLWSGDSSSRGPHDHPLTSLQCGHLLQSLTNSKSFRKGQELHGHMISSGVLTLNTYLNTKLAAMYAICGYMDEARVLFDATVLKSSFLWNVIIRGYACNGFPLDSMVLYREMLRFGKRADNYTYPFVLMACGDLLLVEIGRRIHGEIIVCGYEPDVYVGNSLLSMYSKFGEMVLAWKLFDRMPERDPTSWNTVVSGYAKNGDPGRALSVFALMVMCGMKLDCATLLSVLPACADLAALDRGKEIHAYSLRNFIKVDVVLTNALIDVYVNSDFLIGAKQLFTKMKEKDAVTWNSIISGCARHGDVVGSLSLFRQMNYEGVVTDQVTLVAVLEACDLIASLQSGKQLHAYLAKKGLDKGVIVGTALIDMYAKCGRLNCSRQIFDELPRKNLISWSAMVSGYGLHGRGREAVSCFNQMRKNGLKPDKVVFTLVLSACSHAGLVDEGKTIFSHMSVEYSMKPTVEQCSCMVDLLGRAGHIDDAYDFICNMEVKPNADVWAALLSACRIHRNIELAEIAAQNVFNIKPKWIGPYVTLSNIYATAKRWDDVERVRSAARQKGLKKQPGCSFVELDMGIHRFLVGDKSHPQSNRIYNKMDELRQQLKDAGYAPDTSSVFYDVDEHVKEKMLWDHSERLAIAFALLNTSPGMSIMITKNLRVCGDCHMVTKLISKLVNREIVVRDAHRFHHFQNGFCSCGDYW